MFNGKTGSSSNEKVAIIVPYRSRLNNLKTFTRYMHNFLNAQMVDYTIFLIEPAANLTFNRGLLINIGFLEALKIKYIKSNQIYDFDCFIFHEVDLLPENMANFYKCNQDRPKQMAIKMSIYKYSYV